MLLCTRCRVHPAEYFNVRGGVCTNCALFLTNKYGWTWMRLADDKVGLLGGLVATPSDVQALKDTEHQLVVSIDNDIHKDPSTYAKIPSTLVSQWNGFTNTFGQFYNASVGYVNAQDNMQTAQNFQDQIRTWQKQLAAYVTLTSPILPDPSIQPTTNPITKLSQSVTTAAQSFQTVAVVGLCLGALVFLYMTYEGHKTAGKALDFATAHPETVAKLGL